LNAQLFHTLKSFYSEIERYTQTGEKDIADEQPDDNLNNTEQLVKEIKNLEKLRKGRLFIEP
jgi:hypothetical protein